MTSNATAADNGDGIPSPSPQDQELILDAWREVLGQVLHTRDCEWKEQLRAIKAESLTAPTQGSGQTLEKIESVLVIAHNNLAFCATDRPSLTQS
jgi:hypothetical protein